MKQFITNSLMSIADLVPMSRPALKHFGMNLNYKKVGDFKREIKSRFGKSFFLSGMSKNYLSFQLFWKGVEYYEPITQYLINEILKDKKMFVDVGANIGLYSINAAINNPNVEVISFECNPKLFQIMNDNVRFNNLSIRCEDSGVSDKNEKNKTLYISKSDMTSSLIDGFAYNQKDSLEISTVTLDSYFENNNITSDFIMKLDVEGCEELVLQGGMRVLDEFKPDIVMEVVTNYPDNHFKYLTDKGYKFYSITDEGLGYMDEMKPQIKGNYFFSNYLISVKSDKEINEISEIIINKVRKTKLKNTSIYVNDAKINRIRNMKFSFQ